MRTLHTQHMRTLHTIHMRTTCIRQQQYTTPASSQVSHIDVSSESPVGHGKVICLSIYTARDDADMNKGVARNNNNNSTSMSSCTPTNENAVRSATSNTVSDTSTCCDFYYKGISHNHTDHSGSNESCINHNKHTIISHNRHIIISHNDITQ